MRLPLLFHIITTQTTTTNKILSPWSSWLFWLNLKLSVILGKIAGDSLQKTKPLALCGTIVEDIAHVRRRKDG